MESSEKVPSGIIKLFNSVGAGIIEFLTIAGEMSVLLFTSLKMLFTHPIRFKLTLRHIEFIGINSLIVIMLTGFFTGMVFGLQSYSGFSDFGAESLTGALVALAMVMELGPVLTGLMVAARVGSAVAAEIGTMKVTEQIDALDAMGVSVYNYLVTPRVLAAMVALPLLNVICIFCGLLGGYFVNVVFLHVDPTEYIAKSTVYIDLRDFANSLIKAYVFGLIIVVVACYKGLNTTLGAKGVGKATTESVVISSILILLFDYIITTFLVSL